MKDLPRRTLTAIVFGAVMLAGLLINEFLFLLLLIVIHTGCLSEYYSLLQKIRYDKKEIPVQRIVPFVIGAGMFLSLLVGWKKYHLQHSQFWIIVAIALGTLLLFCLIAYSSSRLKNFLLDAWGLCYISLPLFLLLTLTFQFDSSTWFPDRIGIVLGMLLLIWTNDTMAYFIGSSMGKHKMAPEISPKKSWEGFLGGLIFSVFAGWLLSLWLVQMNATTWMMIAVVVSVFGTIGDLFESMLKRTAGVKDSGSILPGHGGFLDRFDAFIFCVPFVYLIVLFIHHP